MARLASRRGTGSLYGPAMSATPEVKTHAGVAMPAIVYGTAWKEARTAALVEQALAAGFRGVDTACQPKHYDEAGVGRGLAAAIARGVPREALYVQTKFTPIRGQDPKRVPYDPAAPLPEQVEQSVARSLSNLGVECLDGLLLHSPLPTMAATLAAWRAFEAAHGDGKVRQLGVSNCYHPEVLEALWEAARVKPAVLQNRFYADTGWDVALRAFCAERGVVYQSFWTLTANGAALESAPVRAAARAHGKTAEQVFYRALTQRGIVPLIGTTSEAHMREDLAIFGFTLGEAELAGVMGLVGG